MANLYSLFTTPKYKLTLFHRLSKVLLFFEQLTHVVPPTICLNKTPLVCSQITLDSKLDGKCSYQSVVPSAVLLAADPEVCREVFRGCLLGSYSIGLLHSYTSPTDTVWF